MNRRIQLVRHSLTKRQTGGSIKNWLLNCFGPTCPILAKPCIETIEQVGDYKKVKFKRLDGYLFFHNALPIYSLYQTVAEQFYDWQWHYYQIPETTVNKNDIVFDCGCAEGIFAFLNHRQANYIYAFEPLPEYLEGLHKTFAPIDNVSVINSALGAETGIAYLKKAGIASAITTKKTKLKVELDTIDHFCKINHIQPTYIKADLEGYEMNLLAGATETIRHHKPKIAITTYHVESHAREIADYLKSLNPTYHILLKGIEWQYGAPVMLHAW
jgi:FkbM family methyltransferase